MPLISFARIFHAAIMLFIAGCGTIGGQLPQDPDVAARAYAAIAVETWGLSRGTPREEKLRQYALKMFSDPEFIAATKSKPVSESWDEWENRMEREGLTFLSDDSLRRIYGAKSRMLNEASDRECAAFVEVSMPPASRNSQARQAELLGRWHQRLARISEEDFETLSQAHFDAIIARAREINRPLIGLGPFLPSNLTAQDKALFHAGPGSAEPAAHCKFLQIISTAQSQVIGPDAYYSLRFNLNN
jgi:hypothetical protein